MYHLFFVLVLTFLFEQKKLSKPTSLNNEIFLKCTFHKDMSESTENSIVQIKVIFYSSLKNTVGLDHVVLPFPKDIPLQKVLEKVQKDYFSPKNEFILKETTNQLEVGLICLVDDVDLSIAGGLGRKLQKDRTITLITSLHGG